MGDLISTFVTSSSGVALIGFGVILIISAYTGIAPWGGVKIRTINTLKTFSKLGWFLLVFGVLLTISLTWNDVKNFWIFLFSTLSSIINYQVICLILLPALIWIFSRILIFLVNQFCIKIKTRVVIIYKDNYRLGCIRVDNYGLGSPKCVSRIKNVKFKYPDEGSWTTGNIDVFNPKNLPLRWDVNQGSHITKKSSGLITIVENRNSSKFQFIDDEVSVDLFFGNFVIDIDIYQLKFGKEKLLDNKKIFMNLQERYGNDTHLVNWELFNEHD